MCWKRTEGDVICNKIVGNHKPAGSMPSVDLEPAHEQKPSKVKVGDPLIQLKINYETFYRCYPARPFAARTWSRFSL